ncbi:MAG TPA: transposase [Segetibacter sp.]|nr:transposase [Segetibacter sp.]
MKKRNDTKVIFKPYNQQQTMLLLPSLEELIAANHPVRVVNKVLDQVDIVPLIAKYKAGGTSRFNLGMLLKVLVFAYINNIYSSRKIEEALRQNVCFMWLGGMVTPDHNNINRFRGERRKHVLRNIFNILYAATSSHSLYLASTCSIISSNIS